MRTVGINSAMSRDGDVRQALGAPLRPGARNRRKNDRTWYLTRHTRGRESSRAEKQSSNAQLGPEAPASTPQECKCHVALSDSRSVDLVERPAYRLPVTSIDAVDSILRRLVNRSECTRSRPTIVARPAKGIPRIPGGALAGEPRPALPESGLTLLRIDVPNGEIYA